MSELSSSIRSIFLSSRLFCFSRFALLCAILSVVLLAVGCGKRRVSVPASRDLGVAATELRGIASWYGDPFHGRRTSNGEVYNMHYFTAAHRTLPFQTVVRVNNLDNGRQVQVRINDRGPFVEGRIIDLSYSAAQEIDMVGPGTARVQLEILRTEASSVSLAVQVGSFREKQRARNLQKRLGSDYSPVRLSVYRSSKGKFHRVLVGDYGKREEAMLTLRRLKSQGLEGFVIQVDE